MQFYANTPIDFIDKAAKETTKCTIEVTVDINKQSHSENVAVEWRKKREIN